MRGASIGVWDERKRSESWYNMGPSSCLLLLQHIHRRACNNTTSLKSQDWSEPVLSLFTQWTTYSQTPSSLPNLQLCDPRALSGHEYWKGSKCFGEKEVLHILNCSTATAVITGVALWQSTKRMPDVMWSAAILLFVPSMTSVVFTLTVQKYIHRYLKCLII